MFCRCSGHRRPGRICHTTRSTVGLQNVNAAQKSNVSTGRLVATSSPDAGEVLCRIGYLPGTYDIVIIIELCVIVVIDIINCLI